MHRSAWSLPPDDEFGAERIAAAQASHRARLAAMAPRTHTHPPQRNLSHLTERRKKAEVAFERASEIEHSNLLLVQRLRMIVARKQIDNVASVMSQMPRSLNRQKRTAELTDIVRENARIYSRIAHTAPRVPRASKIAREAAELEAVITRHCERPRIDPLAVQQTYYADQRNPFLNFSGGKIKVVHQHAPEEKHEETSQHQQHQQQPRPPQLQHGASHHVTHAGALTLKPTRPQSAAPPRHATSARPGSARPTQPSPLAAHAPQDPLLLARPASARFRPLRMEQNPIALAKHVAALQAQAAAAATVLHARRPPRPASAAAIAASHAARAAQPAAAAASAAPAAHVLFAGPWLISGRLTHLRMHEHSDPWRIEIAVTDGPHPSAAASAPQPQPQSPPQSPTPTEYSLLLDSADLLPFFPHVPDLFSGSERSRLVLVSALKDSLKFVRTAELTGAVDNADADDGDDDESLELCVDLVQSAPKPLLSPRVGSVMHEAEAVKRAAAQAREQERQRREISEKQAAELRSKVAAKPWSIQQLTAMATVTDATDATDATPPTPAPAAATPSPSPALAPVASASQLQIQASPAIDVQVQSRPLQLRPSPPLQPQPQPQPPPPAQLTPSLSSSSSPLLPSADPVIVIPTRHARNSRFTLKFTPAATATVAPAAAPAPAASTAPAATAAASSASSPRASLIEEPDSRPQSAAASSSALLESSSLGLPLAQIREVDSPTLHRSQAPSPPPQMDGDAAAAASRQS